MIVSKGKYLVLALCTGLGAVGLACFPGDASQGAAAGLTFCLQVLIPSSFPFLVLSSFCVHAGISVRLGRLISPVTRVLFHLPGACGATILLSLAGGYPVGTRGIATLYHNGVISQKQANQMLYFCVNAGPAFTISVIGAGLYGMPRLGVYLFLSGTLASLLVGVVLGRFSPKPAAGANEESKPPVPWGDALVLSASDAARGMISACSFVILFATVLALLSRVGVVPFLCRALSAMGLPDSIAGGIFPLVWEITGGSADGVMLGIPFALMAFGVGFAGLCVHFQVLATASPFRPSRWKFFVARLVHGLLSAGFAAVLQHCFPIPISGPVVSVFHNTSQMLHGTLSAVSAPPVRAIAAGAVLIALCIVLLLSRFQRTAPSGRSRYFLKKKM